MKNWWDIIGQVSPEFPVEKWDGPLQAAFNSFAVNTPRRVAACLGQFLVEAGETFANTVEGLVYSTPARLCVIFPSHFPTIASALPYIRNPQALANVVYAGVDGNTELGDGWLWRGRGLIQITGRDEYTAFAAERNMKLDDMPAYCETPSGASASGCWYLWRNGCLPMADGWEIERITHAVNPAMDGASLRLAYSNHILSLLDEAS